jgi:hypothetical protein
MIIAAMVIGSKSMFKYDRLPKSPVKIDSTAADEMITVKKLFKKIKHIIAMQIRMPRTDWKVLLGMYSMRSRNMPSSWKTETSNFELKIVDQKFGTNLQCPRSYGSVTEWLGLQDCSLILQVRIPLASNCFYFFTFLDFLKKKNGIFYS